MKHYNIKSALTKKEIENIKTIEKEMEQEGIDLESRMSHWTFKEKAKYGSKRTGVDAKILIYISYNWFRNLKNTLSSWNTVKNLKVPEEFKKPNKSIIYRGFYLSEEARERFEQGKDIRLKSTWLSAWTEHKDVAEIFTYDHGVIIERPYSTLDIWICLEKLYPYIGFNRDRYTQGMKEILVKGTGLAKNVITKDMIIYSKFTEEGKAKNMIQRELE